MKKICFLVASLFPIPATCGGAVETLVQNIIDYNEIEKKFDITVLTIKNKYAQKKYGDYKFTHFITVPDFKVLNKIYWKIVGFSQKCLHKKLIAPLQRYSEIKFIKKYYSKYDFFIEEINLDAYLAIGSKISFDKKIYHLHCEGNPSKILDSSFAYLLTISDFVGNSWESITGRNPNTVFELPNCIKIDNFKKKLSNIQKSELRKKFNIPDNHTVLIFVGRIVPEKGIKELIEAIDLIKKKNISLLLVGSSQFANKNITNYEKMVYRMINKSNHNIVQTGYVSNKEIYKLQNISDIAVVPSTWQEPAGLVVLEAQAAGLPVIASNVGGIPQFLGKKSGILIKHDESFIKRLSNAIEKLANNQELRTAMGKEGEKWASEHDIKDYYDMFAKIIDKIDEINLNYDFS